MWDEITYPFPNFNSAAVEVWEWISNFIPHFNGHVNTYPCWDGLNLNHVSKRGTTLCKPYSTKMMKINVTEFLTGMKFPFRKQCQITQY